MFKFLRVFQSTPEDPKIETQRDRFERVTSELNAVLAELDTLPALHIDPAHRRIELTAPEQFADEALALPKPTATEPEPTPEDNDKSTPASATP